MAESALERYFDNFIAQRKEEEEEEEEVNEELGDELFLSLLPDELLTQDDADSSTSRDYSSQNPTAAAELPGRSSMPELGAPPGPPSAPVMPVIQIQNVISTVKLGCVLDLNFIACKAWNVEYKKAYGAIIMRIREPRTTAAIFKSGSIVCTGAKSEDQSRLAARKFARILQKLGFPARFLNFQIQNLVASCSTGPVSLEKLALHQACSYEPELFPGLHYKVTPGITATVFSSGKMFLSGAKSEAEAYKAFDVIYPILSRFRR